MTRPHLPVATDAHLIQLAGAHDAVLATLDTAIPGAFLIPSTDTEN